MKLSDLPAGTLVYEPGQTKDPWVVVDENTSTPGTVYLAPFRVTDWPQKCELWYQAFPEDLVLWPKQMERRNARNPRAPAE